MPRRGLQFQQKPSRNLFSSWGSGQMVMSSQGVNLSPDRPPTGGSVQISIKDLIAQIAARTGLPITIKYE
jgi:hypothetical protein